VITNSNYGLLLNSATGVTRRVRATDSNTLSSTITAGTPRARLEQGDICIDNATDGLILRKPNGGYLKISVDNNGAIVYTPLANLTGNSVQLQNGDFEIGQQEKGVILKNSQNECWKLAVNAAGTVTTSTTTCQ